MAAQFTRVPELALAEDESAKLAAAVKRVNDYYGVSMIPEVVQIWVGLGATAAAIYAPRVVAIMAKQKQAKLQVIHRENITPASFNGGVESGE